MQSDGKPCQGQGAAPHSTLPSGQVQVAVVGAHLLCLPLNHQLTDRGGRLIAATKTASQYRLYALPDGKRSGLIRVENGGAAIDCEVWELPLVEFGSFVVSIQAPLGIGRIELDDGSRVNGFICEAVAVQTARDITPFGDRRRWLAHVEHHGK